MVGLAVTAGVIGLAEKAGILEQIPNVPFVGRKGVAAIGLYLLSRNGFGGQMVRDAALVLAAVSAYEYGKTGSVSGSEY